MLHWIKLASYHLSPSTAITSNRKMRLKSPNHSAATRLLDKMHFFQQQKHHTPIPCFFTGGNGSTVGHSVPLHKFRNFKTQQFFHISAYIFMASSICSAKCGSQIVGTLCASLLAFELPLNKWSASCQFAPQALIAVLKVTMLFGTWCNAARDVLLESESVKRLHSRLFWKSRCRKSDLAKKQKSSTMRQTVELELRITISTWRNCGVDFFWFTSLCPTEGP